MAKKKVEKKPVPPEETLEEEEPGEEMYDLLIPPGVPQKLIMEIVNNYDVEVVARREKLYFANMEGDERELLAFRGRKEVLEKVHVVLIDGLKKFIGE